jgi:hypothetical protein
MINKVTMQSASTFSMNYNERSGSVLTRVNELFLRGVKDPRTQIKHYDGLIDAGLISHDEIGFESEVFKFLYFTTDNTALHIEKAYYIVAAQPTKAELSMYSGEKGTYEYPELSMEFSGYPITGPKVDFVAQSILNHITSSSAGNYRFHKDSSGADISGDTSYGFQYDGVTNDNNTGLADGGNWTYQTSNDASKSAASRWNFSNSASKVSTDSSNTSHISNFSGNT